MSIKQRGPKGTKVILGHQAVGQPGQNGTFPIDIIWLDSNGIIIHIEENLVPPNAVSQYALETTAGFAQRHNISLGTNIKFELLR